MNFSNYLIITDLDGTFLTADGKDVPSRNMEAIERFTANGGRFTVATGRLHQTVRAAIPNPVAVLNAPAIVCNGCYLYDYQKDDCYGEDFISAEHAAQLLHFIKSELPDVPFRVSTPVGMRIAAPVGLLANDLIHYSSTDVQILPFDKWKLDDWYKLVFRDEWEVLSRIRPILEKRFGDKLMIMMSGTRFLEIQNKNCNKAVGIKKLLDYYKGEPRRTVIACGDFENDIEMLEAADIAVCPANAIDAVKQICDRVLCSCDEGLMGDLVALIEADNLKKER